MKLVHRGMTLELEDDDPRVKKIEALLFGSPEPEPSVVVEAPVDWLKVEPTEPWLAFWRQLKPVARAWITRLLSEGSVRRGDTNDLQSRRERPLVGLHKHIGAVAKRNGLAFFIESRGHAKQRRYFIAEEAIAPLSKYAKS